MKSKRLSGELKMPDIGFRCCSSGLEKEGQLNIRYCLRIEWIGFNGQEPV
jgi:hypothetical protein